jgi:hypothetical protein
MKKPVRVKRTLLWSVGTLLTLILLLAIHIIWVTWPSDEYHAEMQLGRIDFNDTLNAAEAAQAIQAMKSIDGIQIAKMNREQTSLVYSFSTGAYSIADIAGQFQQSVPMACQANIPDANDLAKGCPVINKRSLVYRFTIFLHNSFS